MVKLFDSLMIILGCIYIILFILTYGAYFIESYTFGQEVDKWNLENLRSAFNLFCCYMYLKSRSIL